ncbi:MAG: glycine cleavage system protein GcvH [Halomonadaceae bacterium]|nr:MAG: glycine cleavage system protein GcvH [Halomonadaceae bacterium]
MSQVPSDRCYIASHQWARQEQDGVVTVGITDFAQAALGDVVFVELPDPNEAIEAGDDVAVAESVKSASEVYSPVTGTVVAVNEKLEEAPELLNEDPYGDGWLFQVKTRGEEPLAGLLDSDAYQALLASEASE